MRETGASPAGLRLFDTHAHYDAPQFDADRDAVLSALPGREVALIVNPGCDGGSSAAAVALAHRYPHVYAAVGWHPESCAPYTPDALEQLRAWCADPKVVAIGEIGLDYYWEENPPRAFQQQVFREQMALAAQLHKPVIVHDREAHGDTMDIIRAFPGVRGVMHCFSGSAEMARELVGLGWMISFTGVLTYKNARRAVEAALAVPMEHLMIETDSPYMAPEPCRGRRCDSSLVRHVCEKLADLKGLTAEECARITGENGCRFFGISAAEMS